MKASSKLIEKMKEFEGLRLAAYQDAKGVWTIGYGHTSGVRRGDRISEFQAVEYLREDLQRAEQAVGRLGLQLTQGQADALIDFAYNCGAANLAGSTLLKYIRQGRPTADIQAQFRRWVYSGGRRLRGLEVRREWEARRWAETETGGGQS